MKNNKILLVTFLIIAIIVAVLIVISRRSTQPTVSVPENWSVFKNDTYKYIIAHPKSWPVDVRSAEQVSIGQIPYEPAAGAIFILVHPEKNLTYLKEFKKGYPEGCKDAEIKTIAGLKAQKLACIESFAGQKTNEYFFEHGKDLYQISFISGSTDLDKIFEKMIQTFHFE